MKKRLSTTLAILALGVSTSFAQRKTITEDYYKLAVEKIPLSDMSGKQTYSYIVSEDGSHQKDGAYSIRCAINNKKIETYAHTFTISGSFTLNTTYSKGRLNGAITSNYRLNVIGANIFGSTKGGISSSLSGGFLNGVPHGAFKISRDGELKTQLTANYKNGMLVGAFSCSMLNDRSQPARYRGNLTQSGKFTG